MEHLPSTYHEIKTEEPQERGKRKKHKIMAVDNEKTTVNLIKEILEKVGYEVVPAFSGKECLQQYKSAKVDLILLDIMMLDMSGWDVYERIRKEDKKVKVVLISVLDVTPSRLESLKKEGISDYITKPFSPSIFVERIHKVMKS